MRNQIWISQQLPLRISASGSKLGRYWILYLIIKELRFLFRPLAFHRLSVASYVDVLLRSNPPCGWFHFIEPIVLVRESMQRWFIGPAQKFSLAALGNAWHRSYSVRHQPWYVCAAEYNSNHNSRARQAWPPIYMCSAIPNCLVASHPGR
jgi:hypothetical protein